MLAVPAHVVWCAKMVSLRFRPFESRDVLIPKRGADVIWSISRDLLTHPFLHPEEDHGDFPPSVAYSSH